MKFLLQAALIPIFTGIVVAAALWQIRNSETTMSRCNQCGKYAGWNSDTFTKRDAAMNAADLNQSLIARLENEMGILQGALNLSRERAEDAEADLAEARRDLALESHRADDAELERDIARVEAMGLAWELGQLRDALDEHNAQVAVTRYPIAPPPTPRGLSAAAVVQISLTVMLWSHRRGPITSIGTDATASTLMPDWPGTNSGPCMRHEFVGNCSVTTGTPIPDRHFCDASRPRRRGSSPLRSEHRRVPGNCRCENGRWRERSP